MSEVHASETAVDTTSPPSRASYRVTNLSFARFCRYVPGLLADRADGIARIAIELGDVVGVPAPGKRFTLVSHPDPARHVLQRNNKNYQRSFDYRIVRTLFGEGLISTHGDTWQHARRVATPHFGRESVRGHGAAVLESVERFVHDRLGGRETVLGACESMSSLSLETFAHAMLGIDIRPRKAEVLETVGVALRHLDKRLVAMLDVDQYLPTISDLRFRRALRRFDALMYAWIDEREAAGGGRRDLFGVLMEASASIEPARRRRWLRDQLTTYLLSGHETGGVVLAWCLHLLTAHPEVQARVREECRAVLGTGELSLEALGELAYTESVLLETLRLYPAVWSLGREALSDDELCGASIPAGTTVMVSPYAMHRRPDLWEDPARFMPERFAKGPPKRAFQYIPFGAGARSCIGEHLAMLELRVIVATILRRFELRRVDDAKIGKEALISLRPKPDFAVRFTRVD